MRISQAESGFEIQAERQTCLLLQVSAKLEQRSFPHDWRDSGQSLFLCLLSHLDCPRVDRHQHALTSYLLDQQPRRVVLPLMLRSVCLCDGPGTYRNSVSVNALRRRIGGIGELTCWRQTQRSDSTAVFCRHYFRNEERAGSVCLCIA